MEWASRERAGGESTTLCDVNITHNLPRYAMLRAVLLGAPGRIAALPWRARGAVAVRMLGALPALAQPEAPGGRATAALLRLRVLGHTCAALLDGLLHSECAREAVARALRDEREVRPCPPSPTPSLPFRPSWLHQRRRIQLPRRKVPPSQNVQECID